MNQSDSRSILEKAYEKLVGEYRRLDTPEIMVKGFGLNPGWNAVIGTNGCCGVAMSFQDNNPLYGNEETLQDLEYLKACVGAPLFDVAFANLTDERLSRRSVVLAALNALSQPFVTDEVLQAKGYAVGLEVKDLVRSDDYMVIVGYGGLVKSYAWPVPGTARDRPAADRNVQDDDCRRGYLLWSGRHHSPPVGGKP